MAQDVIEVKKVSKSFGGVKANVDITMSVKKGSITGIIGPNGCGKSTLFNSIVGYHPIDTGSIKFEGQEISHLRVGDIARLGMLRTFQQTRIYTKMDCVDNMQISVSQRPGSNSTMFARWVTAELEPQNVRCVSASEYLTVGSTADASSL